MSGASVAKATTVLMLLGGPKRARNAYGVLATGVYIGAIVLILASELLLSA